MPLEVVEREKILSNGTKSTYLQIRGTITLPDGSTKRVRIAPQSGRLRQAKEEAAALETNLIREGWHGPKPSIKTFAQAAMSYIETAQRASGDVRRLQRIGALIGNSPLCDINQETINRLKGENGFFQKKNVSASTIKRGLIVPVRAVLRHAEELGWCQAPRFKMQRSVQGRTKFLLPSEANKLIAAAAPHLRPLLIFQFGTGARMSEALELQWRDVDLKGGVVHLWITKNKKARHAKLPPVVVQTLSALPYRDGNVFRTDDGKPYAHHDRQWGGQIKTAFAGAKRRAGIDPDFRPHDMRHTWATWHYTINKDLLLLKQEGDWSSVVLVERYAHLMPAGHAAAIKAFLGRAI